MQERLSGMGLGCVGCPMAQFETIEMGATVHGMDPDALVKELNKSKKKTTKKVKDKLKK